MNRERFEQLVAMAVDTLPEEFITRLENVEVVVQDYPTHAQLANTNLRRNETLLGLYEGVPLIKRTHFYGMVPPDKITIFQRPIEAECSSDDEVIAEIQSVVQHEIAHHFGISDARLREIEREKSSRKKRIS